MKTQDSHLHRQGNTPGYLRVMLFHLGGVGPRTESAIRYWIPNSWNSSKSPTAPFEIKKGPDLFSFEK